MKKILLLIAILFLIPSVSFGACSTACTKASTTYTCTDVSRDCIQDAVTAATEGDTILFNATPASATWSSGVTIEKAITINGNTHTLTSSGTLGSTGFFKITGFTADETQVRITGFTFSASGAAYCIVVYDMTGGVSKGNIRIDNNNFNFSDTQIYYYHGKGLVDNNNFYNPASKALDVSGGSITNQTEAWASMAAGTADALFIEDNHFIDNASYPSAGFQEKIGTDGGMKLVIRYNHFDASECPVALQGENYTAIMTHGSHDGYWEQSSSNRRGQSVVEIYNNQIDGYRIGQAIVLRGSANLVYNNTITYVSIFGAAVYMREEEFEAYGGGQSNWNPARTAWPAEDQVHNTFFWNNTMNGTQINSNIGSYFIATPTCSAYPASCTAGLQKDRDFFLHKPCGANDSTDGTAEANACTHGIETFSNLNGHTDGNGASDTYPATAGGGTTYTAHGTMAFTATGDNAYYNYAAYTYPHPLQGAADVTAPTLSTATINAAGTSLALVFSESVTVNNNTGFVLTPTGAAVTLTYVGGSGTSTLTYTISRPILQAETATLAYTTVANGIEDAALNDLASFPNTAVTNSSTQASATTYTLTATKGAGVALITATPGDIYCGSGCSDTYDSGTVVTITTTCKNGWRNATWSGTGCGASTTMSAERTCTAACSEIHIF